MKDIDLWENLLARTPRRSRRFREAPVAPVAVDWTPLEEGLAALAELATSTRDAVPFPLWGLLLDVVEGNRLPEALHLLALRSLAGAAGLPALRVLVRELQSESEARRHAALEALRVSCRHDPMRWVHAVFHGDLDIRKAALEWSPGRFSRAHLLHLLGDDALRDDVLRSILPQLEGIEHIYLLVDFIYAGRLTLEQGAAELMRLPWQTRLPDLLQRLPYWQRDAPDLAHPAGDALVDWYQQRSSGADMADAVVSLLFGPRSGQVPQAALTEVQGRIHWGLRSAEDMWTVRMGRAALRVGGREGWTIDLLHLASLADPRAVLLDSRIPLETRKTTCRRLTEESGNCQWKEAWLESLMAGDVCRHPDNTPDLPCLSGVIHLAKEAYFGTMLRAYTLLEMSRGFWRNPEESAVILTLPAPSGDEEKLQKQLLESIFTSREARVTPQVLAHLALVARHEGLRFLRELHRFGPTTVVDVLAVVFDLAMSRALSHTRIERLAKLLAEQIGKRVLLDALRCVANFDRLPGSVLAYEVLSCLARNARDKTFRKAFLALEVVEMRALLDRIIDGYTFPYDKELLLIEALCLHTHPDIQSRVEALVATPEERRLRVRQVSSEIVELTDEEARDLTHCNVDHLGQLLQMCFEQPRRGVLDALAERADPRADIEVAAAILSVHDPLRAMVTEFSRWSSFSSSDWSQFDKYLVEHCAHQGPMPMLANAWLHLWEPRLTEFMHQIVQPETWTGLAEVRSGGDPLDPGEALQHCLELGLTLDNSHLCLQMWAASAHVLRRVLWREKNRAHKYVTRPTVQLACALMLKPVGGSPLDDLLPPVREALEAVKVDNRLQLAAAEVLAATYDIGAVPSRMGVTRLQVIPFFGELPPNVREKLRRWIDGQGMVMLDAAPEKEVVSPATLENIRGATDLTWLADVSAGNSATLAEEAALRLSELGEEGREALLQTLLTAPPCTRELTIVIALWPEGPSTERARQLAADESASAFARFHIGLALSERGDDVAGLVLASINSTPSDAQWFRGRDWDRLITMNFEPLDLATELVASPQTAAYSRAVPILMSQQPLPLAALQSFLRAGHDRMEALRHEVAAALHAVGDWTGFPLLMTRVFGRLHGDLPPEHTTLLVGATDALVDATTDAVLAAGPERAVPGYLVEMLMEGMENKARRRCLMKVVRATDVVEAQRAALDKVNLREARARAIFTRDRDVERLAEVFAWGVKLGRELTGKLFSVEMIGGNDLGYTRLNENRIFVNPLPMLRGEPDGEDVVRALIAHELGHHVYHASKEGIDLWKKAHEEKIGGLFNLVLDEHLERNLRARREPIGNALKILAAYGFQHNTRSISAERLLNELGWRSFDVLVSPDNRAMRVARKRGHVLVEVGRIFGEMEANGQSFGRFMRALRMGLGNRHDDDKVAEALALFPKGFRKSSMQELYDITLRLREIFGPETDILGSMGQDHIFDPEGSELCAEGKGIGDDEVQQEVKRITNPRKQREEKGGARDGKGGLWINVSGELDFDEIHHIQKVPYDRAAARELSQSIMRPARKMRAYLESLGLRMEPQKQRLRGRSLDRSRIPSLIIKGDPRVLISREVTQVTDLFLGLVVDCSGSMATGQSMVKARRFAALLSESCRDLRGVDVRIFGFTDSLIYDAGDAHRCAAHGLEANGGNNDAAALWHAAQIGMRSRRQAKLLVMISDGLPTQCSVESLRNLVHRLTRRHGMLCAQIAVRSLSEKCFEHYIEVTSDDLDASIRSFGEIAGRLVRTALNG